MQRRSILILTALVLTPLLLTGCTTFGRGVDAPSDIDPNYAAREAAMMQDSDRCGPGFLTESMPAAFINVIGPVVDGPFRPVCGRHDACYRLKEKTQAWCDDRMKSEMIGICDKGNSTPTYSIPGIGPSLCRFHAELYYGAINNTYGSYAYGGLPGGEITAVRAQYIDDRLSDDEVTICADVHNNTQSMQEYDIEMHTDDGKLVDREPDTYEANVRAGETREFCVGTNFTPLWSVSDLTDTVHISVRADTPNTFAFFNDMVIVDTRDVKIRP